MKKNLKLTSFFLSAVIALSSIAGGGMVFAETRANDGVAGTLAGDANSDGSVNVRDCAFIAGKLAQNKASELPSSADYNNDGSVNVRDAAAIAKDLSEGTVSNKPDEDAVTVFRTGKWSGSDADYYFTDDSSGRMTEKGSGAGVPFGYEINSDGSAVFHIGESVNNTKAAVTFTGENSAVIQWADGRNENLSYSVSEKTSFKPGKWVSDISEYYFISPSSGRRSPKNGTAVHFDYKLEKDGSAVFRSGPASDNTKALVLFTGDESAIVKWQNGITEYLSFVPSEISVFKTGKWTGGDKDYYFTSDTSGLRMTDGGSAESFGYNVGSDGSAVFDMGGSDSKAVVVFFSKDEAVITWDNGKTEPLSYVPSEPVTPFKAGAWKGSGGTDFYFTGNNSGYQLYTADDMGMSFTYEMDKSGEAVFYIGGVDNERRARVMFIGEDEAALIWEDGKTTRLKYVPVRAAAFKTGIWYGNDCCFHFKSKTSGCTVTSMGKGESFEYEVNADGSVLFRWDGGTESAANVAFLNKNEAVLAWDHGESVYIRLADYEAAPFSLGVYSSPEHEFHFTSDTEGHLSGDEEQLVPFTYELKADGTASFLIGDQKKKRTAKIKFIDGTKAVIIWSDGTYETAERVYCDTAPFKNGLWRSEELDYYFADGVSGRAIDKESGVSLSFSYEMDALGSTVFRLENGEDDQRAEVVFFGDEEALILWDDDDPELIFFEAEEIPEYEDHTIVSETVPVHYDGEDTEGEGLSAVVYFMDGADDIPYICVNDEYGVTDWLNYYIYGNEIFVSGLIDGLAVVETDRMNGDEFGTFMQINFEENVMVFWDYDDFFQIPGQSSITDITYIGSQQEDGSWKYIRKYEEDYQRYGDIYIVDLAAHNIPVVFRNGKGYIPLQTFADIFLTRVNTQLLYNGEAIFIKNGAGRLSEDMEKLYYSVEPEDRSEELAEFTFNELCLALDHNYGLKDKHNIKDFMSFFTQTEIMEDLMGTDPVKADKALSVFISHYIDDGHSSYIGNSPYAGKDADTDGGKGNCDIAYGEQYQKYVNARKKYYPDEVPGYEEVGNTAYITFDTFAFGELDHYTKEAEPEPDIPDTNDTLELINYANKQIKRKNSPIENVVVDMSCNGGGMMDAAVFTVSWLLGDAYINIEDPLTGSQTSNKYTADVNFDYKYDSRDNVSDKNIFCLISPVSFSCGNAVPAILKASDKATILGRTSGGGSCAVQGVSCADGTMFNVSGMYRISTVKNGAFYDTDEGVEPDLVLTSTDTFYDRKALTEYINDLN